MLRVLFAAALSAVAMATNPFAVTRTYDASGDTTTITYTITDIDAADNTEAVVIPFTDCVMDPTFNTAASEVIDTSLYLWSSPYTFRLSGNVPLGQSQVTLESKDSLSYYGEAPNCVHSDHAPVCEVTVTSDVSCSGGQATFNVMSAHSAATYSWSIDGVTSSPTFNITSPANAMSTISLTVDACSVSKTVDLVVASVGGSSANCSGTITYESSSDLKFASYPANVVTEAADIPAAETLTATGTDPCFESTIEYSEATAAGATASSYVLVRTWRLTDDCSQGEIATQEITVVDVTPPTLYGVPIDSVVSCDAVPPPCEVSAFDDGQGIPTLVSFSEVRDDGACPNQYTLYRSWTTDDDAGNRQSAGQTIVVQDSQMPVLVGVPDDTTVSCDQVPSPATITAHDNCDDAVNVDLAESTMPDGTIVRTWTAADLCGNDVTASQRISVTDSTAPTLAGVAADVTKECDSAPGAPCEVSAKDSCDGQVSVSLSSSTAQGSCDDEYTVIHTWSASDDSANEASATQTITIVDTTAPVFHGLVDSMTLTCSRPVPGTVTAFDNCAGDVTVAFTDATVDVTSDNQYVTTRTYSATDDCGNTATESRTYTFIDDTPPTLDNLPMASSTVQCSAVPQPANVVATDNCACSTPVAIDYTQEVVTGSCPAQYTLVRTWTGEDCSGNSATFVQTIEVIDTDEPSITHTNVDATFNCEDDLTPANATTADECDESPELSAVSVTLPGSCTHDYQIVRTLTSVDHCGNSYSEDYTIIVVDREAPVLSHEPVHVTSECDNVPDADTVTATDNCASPTVEYTETRVDSSCDNEYTLHRAYDTVDECGHTDSYTQTVDVFDTVPPTILECVHMDAPGTLEYLDDFPDAPTYSASDNCDQGVTVDYTQELTGPVCNQRLTRTWSAYDECGNMATTCQHLYDIIDTTPPTITIGGPATDLECDVPDIDAFVTSLGAPTTTGNNVNYQGFSCQEDRTCAHNVVYVCTFGVNDECANTDAHYMTITVKDSEAPVLSGVPADETLECPATISPVTVTASDVCQGTVAVDSTVDVVTIGTTADQVTYVEVQKWRTEDDCGNGSFEWRTVTIMDTTPPEITCATPDDVECAADEAGLDTSYTASDTCTAYLSSAATTTDIDGNDCDGKIVNITHVVTDDEGNSNSCSVEYVVEDTTPPSCTDPADQTVECPFTTPMADIPDCTDNCNMGGQIQTERTVWFETNVGSVVGAVYRHWAVTDHCGTSTEYAQTMTVEDTTDPVFSPDSVSDHTITCNDALPDVPEITATDTCADTGVTLTYTQGAPSGECEPYTIVRSWEAYDDVGNLVSMASTITVTANHTMSWDSTPNDFDETIEYSQLVNATAFDVAPTASKECDPSIVGACVVTKVNGTCPEEYVLTNVCTATSDCSSDITYTQIRRVIDTEPIVVPDHEDIYLDCTETIPSPDAICTDSEPSCLTCGGCYNITRTCATEDNCGNTESKDHVIFVSDTSVPNITVPADVTIDCLAADPVTEADAEDDCTDNKALTESYDFADLGPTPATQIFNTKVRTWSYTDECGNSASDQQTVTVQDTTPPVMCILPEDVTKENLAGSADVTFPPQGTGTYTCTCPSGAPTDDCSTTIDLECTHDIVDGTCDNTFSHVYSYTATDEQGNDVTEYYTIVIEDTTPPTFGQDPQDATVEVTAIPAVPVVTATDSSGSAVTITYTEERVDGDSENEFSLIRSWEASDNCGNKEPLDQTITVIDTVVIIDPVPGDITVPCHDTVDVDPEDVKVQIDHWAEAGDVLTAHDPYKIEGSCTNNFDMVYNFTATDVAGNVVHDSYTVTVEDTANPEWVQASLPASYSYYTKAGGACAPPAEQLNATDACAFEMPNENQYDAWFEVGQIDVAFTSEDVEVDGANYKQMRTWVATDACGHSISHSMNITVFDDESPTFDAFVAVVGGNTVTNSDSTSLTGNVTGALNQFITESTCTIPAPNGSITCSDECSTCTVTVSTVTPSVACADDRQTLHTYVATDENGNTATYVSTITYEDTTPPYFTATESDVDVDLCEDLPDPGVVTGADDCSTATVTGPVEVALDNATVTRTWTVTDECGNSDTSTQTLSQIDYNPPVLTAPDDVTITCADTVPTDEATASDDCYPYGITPEKDEETLPGTCGVEYTIVKTWTVFDGTHTTTATQTIVVVDDGAPDLDDAPADATEEGCTFADPITLGYNECGTDYPDSVNATTSDAVDVVVGEFTYQQYVHTWSFTDLCGNGARVMQTVLVKDVTSPVIDDACADETIECGVDSVPPCTLNATDDCDATVDVTLTPTLIENSCGSLVTRVWTATDATGNQAIPVEQTITIEDTTEPTLSSIPVDVTQNCEDADTDPPVITATDECDTDVDVTVTTEQVIDENAPRYPETWIHTWVAEDACGNLNTTSQTVTIVDEESIVIDAVADATKDCTETEWIPTTPNHSDNCGDHTLTNSSRVLVASCPYTLEFSWSATDEGGNTSSESATVQYQDVTAPVITVTAPDQTLECVGEEPPAATVLDDCDADATLTFHTFTTPNPEGDVIKSIYRDWVAVDECGNDSHEDQTLVIQDTVDPVLNCSSACDDTTIAACNPQVTTPIVTATDNCDGVISVDMQRTNEGEYCGGEANIFVYCATDSEGHQTCGTTTVTILDEEAPSFGTVPSDTSTPCHVGHNFTTVDQIDCFVNTPLTATSTSEVIDDCSSNLIGTWTATDSCGNTDSRLQTVLVYDDVPPVLAGDFADRTDECTHGDAQTPTATDNCDDDVEIVAEEAVEPIDGTCVKNYNVFRSWTATDDCGLTDTETKTIEVEDSEDPTIEDVCDGVTIACNDTVPTCDPNPQDDCSAVSIAVTEETMTGAAINDYKLLRTWVATDACGNTSPASYQTITVQDIVDPTIVGPADSVAQVPHIPFSYDGDHTAEDQCSTPTVECTETKVDGSCVDGYDLVRRCTASDDSGNSAYHEYTVTVQDTTTPSLYNVPDDLTSEYGEVTPINDVLEHVRADDNSGRPLTVSVTEDIVGDIATHGYTIIRTFTAEDQCGNAVEEEQTVVVEDTCPPTLSETPVDITVDCDAIPAPCTPHAVGEDALTVEYTSVQLSASVSVRTWSVVDEASNPTTYAQTVTVVDDVAPILSRSPADVTVSCSCDTFPAAPTVVAVDNCDADVTVDFTEAKNLVGSEDSYILIRTWEATDSSSNSVTHSQSIVVVDDAAPAISPAPESVDVACDSIPSVADPEAVDNCDPAPSSVTLTETSEAGGCSDSYTLFRTYSSQDRTGNKIDHTQTIAVTDTTPPTVSSIAGACMKESYDTEVTFSFNELFDIFDDCDNAPTLNFVSCNTTSVGFASCGSILQGVEISGEAAPATQYDVYVSASDACGNSQIVWAPIAVYDTQTEASSHFSCKDGSLSADSGDGEKK